MLKGVSERCLKVQEHELTFDVLIMPAGCGTVVLWMENEVAGGDYRYSTWLGFVFGRSSREWVRGEESVAEMPCLGTLW